MTSETPVPHPSADASEVTAGPDEVLILAVDDRRANLVALDRALRGIPARIIHATSGEEALALSLRYRFALAILDVQMPGMDGYELAEILLADPATARTPIIFVTAAYSDEAHQFKGYHAGAVDYLVKPYDPVVLTSKVNVFLELARHRMHLEEMVAERTRALHVSEVRYRTLFETMDQGVIYQDATGRIVDANPAARRLLGLSSDALLLRDSSHPEWDTVREDGARLPGDEHPTMVALRSGRSVHDMVMGVRRPETPGYVWLSVTAIPQFRPGETAPYQVYAMFSDITQRREAAQRLAESERALREVFDRTADGILVLDSDTLLPEMANDAMCRLRDCPGCPPGAAPRASLLPPHLHERIRRFVDDATQHDAQWIDLILERPTDQLVVDVLISRVELRGRPCVLLVFRDMTERREQERERQRLQAELFQAQRVESIGALAGGVAHDFNNLLSVILVYVEMALENEQSTGLSRDDLVEVRLAGERSAALIRQLLAFGRKQALQRVLVDINDVANGLAVLLGRIIGEDIDLSFQLHPGLGAIVADVGQLEQVIMNLAVNARDAMPRGGALLVTTGNVDLSEAEPTMLAQLPRGRYVRLSVSDTGIGMDAETRVRIFEPFFTTKTKDKGSGLGLATVYGIVRQSDGFIVANSEVGIGTTFDLYFPRVEDGEPARRYLTTPQTAIRGGTETILVVEDADSVRSLASRALEAAGYRVLTAIDGYDALATANATPTPIDLVLTDVIMPRMGGEELADRLATLMPDTRVLFMSGYTGASFQRAGALSPATNFVEKPFRVDGLLQMVRQVLDGA